MAAVKKQKMEVEEFDGAFSFGGLRVKFSVSRFRPDPTHPVMQRVYFTHINKEHVIVYYEIKDGQDLYWFPLQNKDHEYMAQLIYRVLVKRQRGLGI